MIRSLSLILIVIAMLTACSSKSSMHVDHKLQQEHAKESLSQL